MLPNSPEVEQVALGPNGIIEGARRGLVFLDMSTISPIVSQKIGKALEAKGVAMLDAPVSGGEKGAIDGALSIMVGGDKSVFESALPIFQAMGKTITLLGPLGMGGFTKLANQIIVAVNLTALGRGADPRQEGRARSRPAAHGARRRSGRLASAWSRSGRNYVSSTYNPGFKIDLHYKDLGLIMESARALGVPLPATAAVQELFSALRVKGRGGLDHSGDHHPAGRPRGRLVRATVDRAGLDPQGRLPKVQIRRIRKGDLSRVRDVFEQSFGDFLERQLGTRPRQAFGGAQYVHHRWLMEPWGCFVAEEDGSKLVGAALAATWGSLGLLGPVAVLTNYHNQSIGQQLIRAAQEFFEENKATLHGAVSYRDEPQAPVPSSTSSATGPSRCWRS